MDTQQTPQVFSKSKRRNLKRRENKAKQRAALIAEEPAVQSVINILHEENPKFIPDVPMIKGVIDTLQFHNLYEALALLEEADRLPVLKRAAASHKWNKSQQRYVEIVLTLAAVMADVIREAAPE